MFNVMNDVYALVESYTKRDDNTVIKEVLVTIGYDDWFSIVKSAFKGIGNSDLEEMYLIASTHNYFPSVGFVNTPTGIILVNIQRGPNAGAVEVLQFATQGDE